jgi:prevent-host-death family protein
MAKIPKIIPVSELRKGVSDVLKRLRETSSEPVVITQRGRAAAVLLDVQEYERTQNEREMLLCLVKGESEIQEGTGYSLDQVLSDADSILIDKAS